MSEVSISVIIPIFNGEKYIDKLVPMLENQSFTDFEVIFVNDGSSDSSAEILADLQPSFNIQIVTQENSGQGAARNTGLMHAQGNYVAFLDQDDSIKSDYLEKLFDVTGFSKLDGIENTDDINSAENIDNTDNVDSTDSIGNTGKRPRIDVVLSGYCMTDISGRIIRRVSLSNTYWDRFICIAPWGKLYRREFLISNDIKFLPVVLGEDIYFNANVYAAGARCQSTDYVGYEWVQNQNSVSHTSHRRISEDVSLFPLYNMIVNNGRTKEYLKNEYFEYFMVKTAVYHVFALLGTSKLSSIRNYKKALKEWLQTNCVGYYKNRLFSPRSPEGENALVRLIVWACVKLRIM